MDKETRGLEGEVKSSSLKEGEKIKIDKKKRVASDSGM
jgi:hypothetical protein